jgi:hypothetical protein
VLKICSIVGSGTEGERSREICSEHAFNHDFLVQVLASYRVLYGQHRSFRSRFSLWKDYLHPDPLLKQLCGNGSNNDNLYNKIGAGSCKSMYSAADDFPLLGERLLRLQHYIDKRTSGDLTTLWHDRINALTFYAFWAVLVIGLIIILLNIGAIVIGLLQLKAAKHN